MTSRLVLGLVLLYYIFIECTRNRNRARLLFVVILFTICLLSFAMFSLSFVISNIFAVFLSVGLCDQHMLIRSCEKQMSDTRKTYMPVSNQKAHSIHHVHTNATVYTHTTIDHDHQIVKVSVGGVRLRYV